MEKKNSFLEFLASKTGKIVMTVISMGIIYGLLVSGLNSNSQAVLGTTLAVCTFFGWKALNRITPDIFLWMSITGWLVYFLIKGLLSLLIGAFVAPFQIGKMISNAISNALNSTNADT